MYNYKIVKSCKTKSGSRDEIHFQISHKWKIHTLQPWLRWHSSSPLTRSTIDLLTYTHWLKSQISTKCAWASPDKLPLRSTRFHCSATRGRFASLIWCTFEKRDFVGDASFHGDIYLTPILKRKHGSQIPSTQVSSLCCIIFSICVLICVTKVLNFLIFSKGT